MTAAPAPARWLLTTAACAAGAAPFVVLGALAGRGLDLTDEGYYLLSVAHPREYLRSNSQFQLLLAPLWEVAGSVHRFRALGLVLLLAGGAVLAAGVDVRLRAHRASELARRASAAAIVAASVAPHLWLPLTPSYNTAVVAASAALAGLLLGLSGDGSRWPSGCYYAIGALWWVVAMAKWPTAALLTVLVIPVVLTGGERVGAAMVRIAAGFGAGLAVTHLALAPLPDIAAGMTAERRSFDTSHDAGTLLGDYRTELWEFARRLVWGDMAPATAVTVALAVLLGWAARGRVATAAAALGGPVLVTWLVASRRLRGGATEIGTSSVALAVITVLGCLFAVVAAGVHRRRRRRADATTPPARRSARAGGWVPVLAVLAMPMAVASGTNNPLLANAATAAACWVAGVVLVVYGGLATWTRPGWVALPLAAATSVAIAVVTIHGTWWRPYRQPPLTTATVAVTDGPFAGLELDPATATAARALDRLGRDHDRAMVVALWKLPALAAATGGRQPLYAWLPADAPELATLSLRAACADTGRPVIVLLDDTVMTGPAGLAPGCADREWARAERLVLADGREVQAWSAPAR